MMGEQARHHGVSKPSVQKYVNIIINHMNKTIQILVVYTYKCSLKYVIPLVHRGYMMFLT